MAFRHHYIERVFDFVERCRELASADAVMRELQATVADLGFSSFIVTGLPLPNRPLEPLVLLSSWPEDWFERYTSQDYFQIDPVGQNVFTTTSPFRWGDAPHRRDKALAQTMMDEAVEFGLADGFCVPIYTATGWQSAFSFASEYRLDAGPKELAAAHLLAVTAHGRLRALLGEEQPRVRQKLTPREREVLTWAAAGKSAWETSAILGISQATVITHLDNIRRKLHVANTTQAVVAALQSGELQPY
ncbi:MULTISPECIES: helix-turn-helix transcriptional regulator [Microvirga]|uniref:helix-turn-helix transcriptional regulator n=1 Tax=Microvirga TaxID=186650 RepID=UPI001CFF855E|nr:LuxR family transcriptional regulator [Microvirga lenta]MCB5174802.1 LuxR family transcriptional regulator [Microvirga lenta]